MPQNWHKGRKGGIQAYKRTGRNMNASEGKKTQFTGETDCDGCQVVS